MKKFCYCIGGTGARVAEVAAHLCAANLAGEEDITFIIVDKDSTCAGTQQARDVIDSVAALASVGQDGRGGLRRSTLLDSAAQKEFCKSNLIVDTWDFSKALERVAPAVHGGGSASLKASLSAPGLDRNSDAVLFDAFYEAKDQARDTAKGFYGRPSIGALIFKHMIESGHWSDTNNIYKDDIAYPIKSYLRDNRNEKARIFIIGSIFGGTGASIFSNLASHIRNSVDKEMADRMEISGALLLPYFTFAAKGADGEPALIDSSKFYNKSKIALNQYGNDPNLMKTAANTSGTFDSLYICGQDPFHVTGAVYSEGGDTQNNHIDFVDLAAAKALAEFFSNGISDANQGAIYEYRFSPNSNEQINFATLNNVPGMARQLKALLLFSGMVITRIYAQLQLDSETPGDIFMIKQLYGTKLGGGLFGSKQKPEWNSVKPELCIIAERLYGYCSAFVRFLGDIAQNGHDWSNTGLASHDREYSFFNPAYVEALNEICSYFRSNNEEAARKAINRFRERTDYVPGLEGPSVTAIEEQMRVVFNHKEDAYNRADVAPDLRMGDYVHEVFKYCYDRSL